MIHAVLQHFAARHHARVMSDAGFHPADDQRLASGETRALRILVLGSGVTSGWGVHTHGLALIGQLQHLLGERLQRPCDIELVGDPWLDIATASKALGTRATEEWDGIVVATGVNDAMRLTPADEWSRHLGALLAKLDADMPPGALVPVVVVGIPPADSIERFRSLLTPVVRRHAEALNELTIAQVARNRRASYVPLGAMIQVPGRPFGSPDAYSAWAATLADALAAVLPRQVHRLDGLDPAERLAPVLAAYLDDVSGEARERLRRVVEDAAASASAVATLNLVSGDRLWVAASSLGSPIRSLPLRDTLDRYTIRTGSLDVPDVAAVAERLGLDQITRWGFSSYRAVALEVGGRTVGTIALFNPPPGSARAERVLRSSKAAAEAELLGLLTGISSAALPEWTGRRPAPAVRSAPAQPDTGELDVRMTSVGRAAKRLRGRWRFRDRSRKLAATPTTRAVPPEWDYVRVPGPQPLRVLLVGGEYSIGYGADSRLDALDGALARLLHVRTGRGVVVENRSRADVRLLELADSLGEEGARTFDLVVWTPTFLETIRTLGSGRWLSGVAAMLRRIEVTSDAATILVGIPSLLGNQPYAVLGRATAGRINRWLRRAAGWWDHTGFVEPPGVRLSAVETADGPSVYRETAIAMLPAVLEALHQTGALDLGPRDDAPAARLVQEGLFGGWTAARSR